MSCLTRSLTTSPVQRPGESPGGRNIVVRGDGPWAASFRLWRALGRRMGYLPPRSVYTREKFCYTLLRAIPDEGQTGCRRRRGLNRPWRAPEVRPQSTFARRASRRFAASSPPEVGPGRPGMARRHVIRCCLGRAREGNLPRQLPLVMQHLLKGRGFGADSSRNKAAAA